MSLKEILEQNYYLKFILFDKLKVTYFSNMSQDPTLMKNIRKGY